MESEGLQNSLHRIQEPSKEAFLEETDPEKRMVLIGYLIKKQNVLWSDTKIGVEWVGLFILIKSQESWSGFLYT